MNIFCICLLYYKEITKKKQICSSLKSINKIRIQNNNNNASLIIIWTIKNNDIVHNIIIKIIE